MTSATLWHIGGDFSDAYKKARPGRRQAVLRAAAQLPVGGLLPEEPVAGAGLRRHPTTLDEMSTLGEQMKTDGLIPDRVRRQGRLAGDGHLRHPQHAHQRLRLPRQPDGAARSPGRATRSRRSSSTWAWPAALPPARTRSAAPGRRPPSPCSRRSRACTCSGMFVGAAVQGTDEQDDLDFFTFPEIDSEHRHRRDRRPDRRLHDVAEARATRTAPRSCSSTSRLPRRPGRLPQERHRATSIRTTVTPTPAATPRCSRRRPSSSARRPTHRAVPRPRHPAGLRVDRDDPGAAGLHQGPRATSTGSPRASRNQKKSIFIG